jgi:uncharacterized protein YndB with AHSA1/START domain
MGPKLAYLAGMNTNYTANASIRIRASTARVWDALTNPEVIKQYLFGTQASADWRVGGTITYRGEWEGKPYEDRGTILAIEPESLLKTTYWSSFSGVEDRPENYNTITYDLEGDGEHTTLSIRQENNRNKESAEHSEANWQSVLKTLKGLLES